MSADLTSDGPDVSLRRLFALAWPLALHGLVTVAVAANDVVLLGRESSAVLAAAAVATSVTTVAVMTLGALGMATQIESSRAFGRHDDTAARTAAESTLRAAAAVGMLPWLGCWVAAPWLTGMIGGSAADPAIAGTYLRIALLGLPFAVLSAVLRAYATAGGATRIVLLAGLATAGGDIVASLAGRSLFGWHGVAAGTVVGYLLGAAVLVGWSRRLAPRRRPRWNRWAGGSEAAVLRLGWPEMVLAAFSSASSLVVVIVLAASPSIVLAANRLLDVQVTLAWVLLSAVGQALLTLLGQADGAGRMDLFDRTTRAAGWVMAALAGCLFVGGGLVAGAVVGAVGGPSMQAVVGDLGWVAWAQVFWQAACVLALAVCRARRDTRAALLASLVGEYVVFLPVGLLLCRGLGWDLAGVMVAHHLFWATFIVIAALRAVHARHGDVKPAPV